MHVFEIQHGGALVFPKSGYISEFWSHHDTKELIGHSLVVCTAFYLTRNEMARLN